MTSVKSIRLPKNLLELIKLRATEERVDESTSLRQLVYLGAEKYIMNLYKEGKISIERAASLLDRSVFDLYDLATKHGIEVGATPEQQRKSEKYAEELA